jgi:type IV pilus assembly protein PilY1
MDGEAVALVTDHNHDGTIDPAAGDSVWVYIGQRRGGHNLYAFDMSEPDMPQFKWQVSNKVPGFERLALTFSTPRVALLDLLGVGPVRALVFAGGYNGGWNGTARIGKDAGAADDGTGNAIYVVNADTGELIWQAAGPGALQPQPANGSPVLSVPALRDSIPSALSMVDADDNGSVDRAYVGDSGGNVWRIDLSGGGTGSGQAATDPALWSVSKVASLGGSRSSDRRFFHAPDFVRSRDEFGNYDGVVIATGDRAAPARNSVNNYLFLLKDRATAPTNGKLHSTPALTLHDLPDISLACDGSDELACAAVDLSPGWRLALQAPGEKALSSPLVSNGRILFSSYLPALKAQLGNCVDRLGWGRVYAVKLRNGGVDASMAGLLTPLGQTTRYTRLGVGIPGEILPYNDQVLLPGPAYAGRPLLRLPGPGRWRAYWREEDVDFP